MATNSKQDEILAFRKIFDEAFRVKGSQPGPDDWSTCYSIVEIRWTSLALAEQYRKGGDRLKVQRLVEKAEECEQVFSDLAAYLAEDRLH